MDGPGDSVFRPPEESSEPLELPHVPPAPRPRVAPPPPVHLPPVEEVDYRAADHAKWLAAGGARAVQLLVIAIVSSVLPERMRQGPWTRQSPLALGTMITGLTQSVLAPVIAGSLYLGYVDSLTDTLVYVAGEVEAPNKLGLLFGFSLGHFLGFLFFTPVGLYCLYNFTEGLVRVATGLGTGKALGTGTLWFLDLLWQQSQRLARRAIRGKRTQDELARSGDNIILYSFDEKDIGRRTALSINGELYRFVHMRTTRERKARYQYVFSPGGDGTPLARIITIGDDVSWRSDPSHCQ